MNSACKYGSNTYDRYMSRIFITLFIIGPRRWEGFNHHLMETKRLNYKRWCGESPRLPVVFSLMRFQQSSAVKIYAAVKRYSIFRLICFRDVRVTLNRTSWSGGSLPDLRVSNLESWTWCRLIKRKIRKAKQIKSKQSKKKIVFCEQTIRLAFSPMYL